MWKDLYEYTEETAHKAQVKYLTSISLWHIHSINCCWHFCSSVDFMLHLLNHILMSRFYPLINLWTILHKDKTMSRWWTLWLKFLESYLCCLPLMTYHVTLPCCRDNLLLPQVWQERMQGLYSYPENRSGLHCLTDSLLAVLSKKCN